MFIQQFLTKRRIRKMIEERLRQVAERIRTIDEGSKVYQFHDDPHVRINAILDELNRIRQDLSTVTNMVAVALENNKKGGK